MGAEAPVLDGNKALPLVHVRSRATRDDDGAGASTPSLGTPVAVPFLWEDAPGRPKHLPMTDAATGTVPAACTDGGADIAKPRLMPLKLPPRLQVPYTAAADRSLSPKTVLHGPYYGCTGGGARRPPRTALRRVGSYRWTPSAAGGFFSRRKTDKKGDRDHDAGAPDASCTPSPSSASSSSSSSSYVFFFGDDSRGHGGRPDPEAGEGANKGVVRITRFRRNRSLPTMTTSHLWASIRKSVKQIAPWS